MTIYSVYLLDIGGSLSVYFYSFNPRENRDYFSDNNVSDKPPSAGPVHFFKRDFFFYSDLNKITMRSHDAVFPLITALLS